MPIPSDFENKLHGLSWDSLESEARDFIEDLIESSKENYDICRSFFYSPTGPAVVLIGDEWESDLSSSDLLDRLITAEDVLFSDKENDTEILIFKDKAKHIGFTGISHKKLLEITNGCPQYDRNGYGRHIASKISKTSLPTGKIYQKVHLNHVLLTPLGVVKSELGNLRINELHVPSGLLYRLEQDKISYVLLTPKKSRHKSEVEYSEQLKETSKQELHVDRIHYDMAGSWGYRNQSCRPTAKSTMSLARFATRKDGCKIAARNDSKLVAYDASSRGEWGFLSPFHFNPEFNIPVPGRPGLYAHSVESIWQGLKIIDGETDFEMFKREPRKRPSLKERKNNPNSELLT